MVNETIVTFRFKIGQVVFFMNLDRIKQGTVKDAGALGVTLMNINSDRPPQIIYSLQEFSGDIPEEKLFASKEELIEWLVNH